MDLGPGQKLSRFILERPLGKGASGIVFLAKDTLLNQPVALKVLHPWLVDDSEVRERFKREIVLTRRVQSPGVCRLHDVHEDSGHTFITMELIEGQTLASLIHKEGRLSPTRVLDIVKGLVGPLTAAHEAGVIHRDLKPGNIMIRPDGSVCVLDFGMATAQDVTKITQAGRTVGSLRFIAPEVWQGETATAASDIYAVGVVLFACMAGRLPYDATTPAEAFKAQKQGPPSLMEHNTAVTPGIDAVVKRAMARKPADRFPNMGELATAFDRALQGDEPTTATGTVVVRARDAQEVSNVRLTAMKEPEGDDVFAAVTPSVPRPVLIGAGIAVLVLVGAVIAALLSTPSTTTTARASPDAGPKHLVDHATDAEGAENPAPSDPSPSTGPRPTPSTSTGPIEPASTPIVGVSTPMSPVGAVRTQASAAMKKRGLLPGDVPEVDALFAKAKRLDGAGKNADAMAAWERARDAAARATIDRGFITAKQKRLRFVQDKAGAQVQGKIGALEAEAEKLVVQRDYAGANEKLNRAFLLLR